MRRKTTKVCPHCGNPDIDYASMRGDSGSLLGIGLPEKYYCPVCRYSGSVILEMTNAQLKKHKFKQTPWKNRPGRPEQHKSVEIIRPVFTVILLAFFFLMVIFMIPKYEISKAPADFTPNELGTSIGDHTGDAILITVANAETIRYGETYLKVKDPQINTIDDALGLENVGGFLVPVFFLFFMGGFFVLMIYNHWHRVRFFTN